MTLRIVWHDFKGRRTAFFPSYIYQYIRYVLGVHFWSGCASSSTEPALCLRLVVRCVRAVYYSANACRFLPYGVGHTRTTITILVADSRTYNGQVASAHVPRPTLCRSPCAHLRGRPGRSQAAGRVCPAMNTRTLLPLVYRAVCSARRCARCVASSCIRLVARILP